MVSELRTEAGTTVARRCNFIVRLRQGCDGCTRYSAGLSMNHFSSVADEAYIVRYR